MAVLIEQGKDQVSEEDAAALRLPNAVKTQSARLTIATDPDNSTLQMVMSPTSFLQGRPASPRLASF